MTKKPSDARVRSVERMLKALANYRRLMIVLMLRHKKEATVGEISAFIHVSFKSTSRHLSVLSAAGIVEKEQRSLQVYYRLAMDAPLLVRHISNSCE